MNHFQNKNVLVTGGSAGLGCEIAKAFGGQGANIVLAARDEQRLTRAARELRSSNIDVSTCAVDVTCDAQVTRLFDFVDQRFSGLDVLVHAVGRSTRGRITEVHPQEFDELWQLNFVSAVRCTRAALPRLAISQGSLVHIGSLAGRDRRTVSGRLSQFEGGADILLPTVTAGTGGSTYPRALG